MKTFKIDLSENFDMVEIHTLADLHIGDPHCNIKKIEDKVNYIKEKKNTFVILNGDIMNNATTQSVSDTYSETLSPMAEVELATRILSPIKDKILCITTGNHERRTYKQDGIDLTQMLALKLGLEDKYTQESAVLFVRLGWNAKRKRKQWYSLYVTHGSGGGRKAGSKASRLEDMAAIVDVDVYIHSHTHLPVVMKQGFIRTDFINSAISNVTKLFVNTSAMLEYGGYGEAYEFKPSSTDTPTIYLNGTRKDATASL